MAKRKGILNTALRALLAGVETSALGKISATFISELASLPEGKQKLLARFSQEQFNELLTQSDLATINAAASAAGTEQIKVLVKKFDAKATAMLDQIVNMLREELTVKNSQIEFLQGQITRLQQPEPSARARDLAEQIPDDAEPYALALKAIAGQQYDDARRYFTEAQEQKEADLAKIYSSHGEMEIYAGNYHDAAIWHEKATGILPGDRSIWGPASIAFYFAAQYDKIEPLVKRVLEKCDAQYVLTECAACGMPIEHISAKRVQHPVKVLAWAYGCA